MQSKIQNPKPKIGLIQNVTVIGIGMMGGSLALALRERGLCARIFGVDADESVLEAAIDAGAIDAGTTNLLEGVRDADLIVFATPVPLIPAQMEVIAAIIAPLDAVSNIIRPDALITDIGSVKAEIVAAGKRLFGRRFVGGHPMAGSEKSGFGAARSDLFDGAAWAIVRAAPFALEADEPAQRIAALVSALGAVPIPLDAERHDKIVALVSHLPHLLAFAFAETVAANPDADLARRMAGGSYRDIMRVSAADPALWQGIFQSNRAALLDALTAWETQLAALKSALLAE